MMNIRTDHRMSCAAEFGPPRCPRCSSAVLMAERAEFGPDGRIRHTWSCDYCGNVFVTSIRMHGHQAKRSIPS